MSLSFIQIQGIFHYFHKNLYKILVFHIIIIKVVLFFQEKN
jgi:hypothetical protein